MADVNRVKILGQKLTVFYVHEDCYIYSSSV